MTGARPIPNQKLRHERERRGWSQQDVADKVGTTPLNVGRWERGVTLPGPHFRQKLSEIFKKTAQELGLVPEHADTDRVSPAPSNAPATPLSQEAFSPLWNVPYNRNLFFTGREDTLAQLHDAFLNGEQPVALAQPQAISGLGGIGKTQTAVEYAYRYRESYDAVLWARADSADLLSSDFLLIAALLNLPQRNDQDQSMIVKAVIHWFDTHERWLLILDNADNLEMVNEFIPSAGKGHVLLTTRANSTGTIAQRIELDTMEKEEGTLFLLRRAKLLKGTASSLNIVPEALRNQAQEIVEAVDGLPLALDQAGAYIEETGCSVADYLKFYKTRRNRLLRMRGRDATGHPEPVATTWSLSFEKVERANPAAAELLRLCAFLHPDEIPESMIVQGASELGLLLQPVAEDELELNEAIKELHKYSLIKRDPELKLLNIHRLVQVVLKDGMDRETQKEWAERTVLMVNRMFPKVEFTTWHECQRALPHAQVCKELIEHWDMNFAEAARLLNKAGYYLQERGQYEQAELLLQQALSIRGRMGGSVQSDVAQSLNDLAWLYNVQGKYEQAEQLFQRALAIRKQVLEPNHPDLAQSLNNLAELYDTLGKYTQAEPLYQHALRIREQSLGSRHLDVAHSLNNLAWLYREQGNYSLAESSALRALAICEEILDPTHPELATSLNSLGAIYYCQGKYVEAEPIFKRALAVREQILGPEHPEVASSLNNLSTIYRVQGRYAEAEPLYQRALAIYEQQLGPQHSEMAYTLNNLGKLYYAKGEYMQAEVFYQRSLAIREQQLGPQHPDTANSLNSLAELYSAREQYDQARVLYQRVLAIREQILGTEHPDVASTLENFANLFRKIGDESGAIVLELRAQAIREKVEPNM